MSRVTSSHFAFGNAILFSHNGEEWGGSGLRNWQLGLRMALKRGKLPVVGTAVPEAFHVRTHRRVINSTHPPATSIRSGLAMAWSCLGERCQHFHHFPYAFTPRSCPPQQSSPDSNAELRRPPFSPISFSSGPISNCKMRRCDPLLLLARPFHSSKRSSMS